MPTNPLTQPLTDPKKKNVPGLSPEDINFFDTARRRLRTTFDQGSARNAFNRGVLTENQAADLDSLSTRFNRMRERLPGGFAQRGLLNSGIYHQGLQEYAQDRQSALDAINRGYGQQLGGLTLAQQQLDQQFTGGLGDIESQESARRQALAAALRSVL